MERSSAFDWESARTLPNRPGVTYVKSRVSGSWVPVNTFDVSSSRMAAQPVEARDEGVHISDYFKSVMAGSASLVSGAGWALKHAPLMESFGQAIEEVGNDAVSYWDESLSDGAKQELAKQFVQKNEAGEYEWGDAGVQTALLTGTRSLPSMAGGMGVGAGVTKVLQVFANPVGRSALAATIKAGSGAAAGSQAAVRAAQAAKKLKLVDTVLGATGFGIGEAAVAAPDAGAQVERQVRSMPLDKLTKSERWREVYDSAEDLPEDKRIAYATDTIAKEASSQAGWQSGLTTFLLGGGAGAYYGRLLNRGAAAKLADSFAKFEKTTMGRVATGAAVEGAQEFAQSGAQQYMQNRAIIDWADPDMDPLDQVLEQAVGGAVVGAPLGAGFSAMQGGEQPEQGTEFDNVLDAAQEGSQFDPDQKLLPGPVAGPEDADFVVDRGGTAQTPEQAGRPRLGAPDPVTDFEVGEEGVARKPGAGARLALPAPEPTDIIAVDGEGNARPQTKGERGQAEARVAAEDADFTAQERERGVLGQQETGTNPGRSLPIKIKHALGPLEPAKHADGEAVHTRYAVVELSDLQTSNDHQTGLKNKKYPAELQPRKRAPADIRANAMSPRSTFKAAELLKGGTTGQGTPIIGPDGFVESGNGRVMNLKAIAGRGGLEDYHARLDQRAADLGIPAEQVAQFREPVLVRVRQQFMEAEERTDFAQRANAEPPAAQPSAPASGQAATPEPAKRHINAKPDVTQDSLIEFLARHGRGIDYDEAQAQGLDKSQLNSQETRVGVKRAFKRGGMSFDEAAELVSQHGFPVTNAEGDYTANDLLNALDRELRGEKVYSQHNTAWMEGRAATQQAAADEATKREAERDAEEQAKLDRQMAGETDASIEDWESQANSDAADAADPEERAALAELLSQWEAQAEAEREDEIDRLAKRDAEDEGDQDAPAETAGQRSPERNPPAQGADSAASKDELKLTAQAAPAARASEKPASTPDLFGQDTSREQGLADETRRRDAARNEGQQSLETGDPGDMFSQARQQQDLTDKPAAEEQGGASPEETAEIAEEFEQAEATGEEDGQAIHHLFESPSKGEVVRLQDKARVHHAKHGWMTVAQAKARIEEWKQHAAAQGETRANADKVVLSFFDLTGAWSQPWEDAGYNVFRFDIQADPEAGDVNAFSTQFFGDWFGDFDGMDIYAILAACPCTDFASSGARHFAAKDSDGRTRSSVELVHQTLRTIEYFKPAVWAIENPVGRIESLANLPPWRLSFDPNHLGDPYTKKTLLWGRFNGDLPVAPVEPTEGSKMHQKYGGKSQATKNARSVTPEGFSYGFFMANNAIDHPAMAIASKFDRLNRGLIEKAVAAGVTEAEITHAVEDFYYMDLDDAAANKAIAALAEQANGADRAETQTGLAVDSQDAAALRQWLEDDEDPATGKKIKSEGRRIELQTELEQLESAIAQAGEFLDAAPAPKATALSKLVKYFSGMSRIGDLKNGTYAAGGAKKLGIGADIGEVSRNGLKQIAHALVNWNTTVFVDSGAFSLFKRSMKATGGAEPLDFASILEKYDTLLDDIGETNEAEEIAGKLLLVMPDIVGDQAGSLALVEKHKLWILAQSYSRETRPIVPIQKGALSLAQAYQQVVKTLGTADFIVGVPSNEKAVTNEELRDFINEAKPTQIHFLGSLSEKKLAPKLQMLDDAGIDMVHVSADANQLRAMLYGKIEPGVARGDAVRATVAKAASESSGYYFIQVSMAGGKHVFLGQSLSEAVADYAAWRDEGAVGSREITALKLFHDKDQSAQSWKEIGRVAYNGNVTITDPNFDALAAPHMGPGDKFRLPAPAGDIASQLAGLSDDALDALVDDVAEKTGAPQTEKPAKQRAKVTKPKAAAIRRGRVGDKLAAGEVVLTASGRKTSAFPPVKLDTVRKASSTVKAVDKWLMENALAEAASRGDDFNARAFLANKERPSQSDKDSAEEYLFGEDQPPVVRSLLRDLTTPKPRKATSAAERIDTKDKAAVDRTTGDIAKSLGYNLSSAGSNALKGLTTLFGGTGKLSSGLTFDEDTYAKAKPHFKAMLTDAQAAGKDLADFVRSLVEAFGSGVKPYLRRFAADLRSESASGSPDNLERDSADAAGQKPADEAPDAARPDTTAAGPGPTRTGSGVRGGLAPSDARVLNGGAATARERRDQPLHPVEGQLELEGSPAGSGVDSRGGGFGDGRVQADRQGSAQSAQAAARRATDQEKLAAQKAANRLPVKLSDKANIDATLPYLNDGQREDVKKAEDKFSQPTGYGILYTNGTGTGKTFTGLGIIRRFATQGKDNILIGAPNDKIIDDWITSGARLGLTITKLESTDTAGKGIVIATYANIGQNLKLADRDWDLVTGDEAHYLIQGKDGNATNALATVRAITLHPDGIFTRARMIHRDTYAELDAITALERGPYKRALTKAEEARRDVLYRLTEKQRDDIRADVAKRQGLKRPRALFLSATPFAYEKTVEWANGYLFDWDEGKGSDTGRGYNGGSNRDQFFMQHFGYRMRYNKLTEPDEKVDRGLMQRQFNSWLKKNGVLSSRILDVEADYDRRFVLLDSGIGNRIDALLDWTRATEGLDEKARDAKYKLYSAVSDKFDYLSRRYLLEAIKAEASVDYVRKSLALGRKVVVFHDYKKGGGFNPFVIEPSELSSLTVDATGAAHAAPPSAVELEMLEKYNWLFADLIDSDIGSMRSPIQTYTAEFPGVLLFNGDVPSKQRRANVAKFIDDESGPQVILVQSAAGKEGISLHDTTGTHQRTLLNLGLPTQPTTAIQQEGRTYRTGQVTDAIFRYFNTGTSWEKWAFATTIAQRASAAENLAQGEQARALKDAFIAGFQEADEYPPGMPGEGTGGKERDKASNEALTDFDRATAFYWGTQKKNSRTKAREGNDYFATPEPVGLKMMEWAGVRPGERVLEPSAGHGAIARWAPTTASATAVEPSSELASRLAMVFDGEVKQQRFEDLNIINKYDAVVMNPPFGSGGRTAIDHLDKAVKHLRDGGRVVALIPTGPAADAKFEKWYEEVEGVYMVANIALPQVTFERAATSQPTRIVVLDKVSDPSRAPNGVHRELTGIEDIRNLFERIRDMDIPARPAPVEPVAAPVAAASPLPSRSSVLPAGWSESASGTLATNRDPERGGIVDRAADGTWFAISNKGDTKTEGLPSREAALAALGQPAAAAATPAGTFEAAQTIHGKTGKPVFVAKVVRRMPDEEYRAQLAKAKAGGGYYSSFRGSGAIPGFQFKTAAERDAFMAGSQVNDAPALYSDDAVAESGSPYETDLFGEKLPAPARAPERAEARGAGTRRDSQPSADLPEDTEAPAGIYHVRTVLSSEVSRRLGARRIRSAADLAQATQSIYRNAVERFDAVVTDKDDVPLAIVGNFKGTIDGASVHPYVVLAEAVRVKGAANIWFSHNHPSGMSDLSGADNSIFQRLRRDFEGSGIQARGIIAVGSGEYSSSDGHFRVKIPPADGEVTVPVLEREQQAGNAGMPALESPDSAKRIASEVYQLEKQPGLILMDNRHRLSAWVPLPDIGPKSLVGTGGLHAIYRAVSEANSAAAIIVHGGELDGKVGDFYTAAQNIGTALSQMDVRVLDIINAVKMTSEASTGKDLRGHKLYSKRAVTKTPAFKAWFGDSKVVDAKGEPLRVYHGTFADFSEFMDVNDKEDGHPSTFLGTFFTDSPAVANNFSGGDEPAGLRTEGANVMPVYLSIKNPYVMPWAQFRRDFIDAADRDDRETSERAGETREALKEQGYDGIVVRRSKTSPLIEAKGDQWIAFEPTQIKSAVGNAGAFDGNDANILHSKRARPKQAKADPKVRAWLQTAAKALEGAADIHIVDSLEDLRRESGDPGAEETEGVYVSDEQAVYIVVDQLASIERAQEVFAHEVFGHLAMEKHADMVGGIRMVHAMREANHRVTTELWNEVARRQPDLSRTEHAKEVIALMAERGVRNSAIDRLVSAFKALLRKLGISLEYSDTELRGMIARAARALRREAAGHTDRNAAPSIAQAVAELERAEAKGDGKARRAALRRAEEALAGISEATGNLYSKRAPMSDAAQKAREAVMAGADEDKLSVKDRMREAVRAAKAADSTGFKQGLVDFAASIEKYERAVNGGNLMDAAKSIYKQVLSTQNLGSVMTAVLKSGIPVWRDGSFQVEKGRKGLAAIFDPLTSHADGNLTEHFELYAAARRASRLITEGRENLFTPEQIAAGMALAKQYPVLERVFDDWQAFNKQSLDMMEEAGLIDPEARALWDRNDYVPFYRAMDEVGGVEGPSNKGGVANQRSGIRSLKGGENKLGNIIENMMMNVAHAVDASYKNRAATMVADTLNGVAMNKMPLDWKPANIPADQLAKALRSISIDVDKLTPDQKAKWGKVFRPVAPAGSNIVTVMRGGKPEYYEVLDPLLLRSLTAMRGNSAIKQLDLFGMVTGAKRLLTNTVTAHPHFIIANFVRDTLSTWVQSPLKLGILTGAYRGFRDVMKNDPDFVAIMAAGGGGGQIYDSNPAHLRKLLGKKMPDAQVDGFLRTIVSPGKLWSFYRQIQQAAENANRLRVYRAALASGASQAEAVYQARDVLNFSLRGDHAAVQAIAMSVPFFNARLQGLYRLQRGYKENRAQFVRRGLMLMGATLALLAMNWDDERYQDLQEWDRDTYWHVWFGDQHWRIPKPFEVGALFAMMPERAVRALLGEDDTRVVGQAITRTMMDTFAFNPLPQLMKPVFEQYQNKLFFTGRPIVGLAQEGLKPEAQYNERTSPTIIEIAKAMPTAAPEWLRSPMRLEALVRGYLGSMGMASVAAADGLTRAGLGYPDAPAQGWHEIAFSRFLRAGEPHSTKYTDELYRMAEAANEASKTVNTYIKQGRIEEAKAARIEYKDQIAARAKLNRLVGNMRKLNQTAARVMNDERMTADTKRERLDTINARRNDIARLSAQFSDYF